VERDRVTPNSGTELSLSTAADDGADTRSPSERRHFENLAASAFKPSSGIPPKATGWCSASIDADVLAAQNLSNYGDDHASAQAELRGLRSRFAAGFGGCADLLLRVHVLPKLRRDHPERPLPELRRRIHPPADPTGGQARNLAGIAGAVCLSLRAAPPRVERLC